MTRAPSVRVEVYVDLPAGTTRAGIAFMTSTRGELTTAFDDDPAFLSQSDAFDLSPGLKRSSGGTVTAGLPRTPPIVQLLNSPVDEFGGSHLRRCLVIHLSTTPSLCRHSSWWLQSSPLPSAKNLAAVISRGPTSLLTAGAEGRAGTAPQPAR